VGGGDNGVLMLLLLCLLLYSVIAHSEGDYMVIITNIYADGWLDDWGWGYSRIQGGGGEGSNCRDRWSGLIYGTPFHRP